MALLEEDDQYTVSHLTKFQVYLHILSHRGTELGHLGDSGSSGVPFVFY